MNILINAASCKKGGGIQVADSICRQLERFPKHRFTVVLAGTLSYLSEIITRFCNVEVYIYTLNTTAKGLLTGRNAFLDSLTKEKQIDVVYTIFGPSTWRPKVPVVAGFGMGHLVLDDSPFWKKCGVKMLMTTKLRNLVQRRNFAKLSDCYYTENPYITEKVRKMFSHKRVETITNNYNLIFDKPELWDNSINLPAFDGITLLTVSAFYPHKNLDIIPRVIDALHTIDSAFKVRFVVTVNIEDFGMLGEAQRQRIVALGNVNITQCPNLYRQCDMMFLPTLLECFSASYAEAMKMGKPVLTSNLDFARSLCGDAAVYFSPLDPEDIAWKIYNLATNSITQKQLIHKGYEQLKKFDTPGQRADKIIGLIEETGKI